MLFNSLDYFKLLFITVVLYWAIKNQNFKKAILFIASYVFYASWSGKYFLVVLFCGLLNWFCSKKLIETGNRLFLHVAVMGSLAVLAFFKYTNFFVGGFWALLMPPSAPPPAFSILLPLGVSFYTFQLIAYTIDVSRKKIEPERNPIDVILFVIYFPHLIAGPICRAPQLIPQLKKANPFSLHSLFDGLFFLLGGFFLKTSVADAIAPFVNVIYAAPEKYSGLDNLWATLGFAIQIYGDFCGYSLMALGSAKMFNMYLPFNFDLPYFSLSLREFWKRWHISLSNWLRDFLYISLGGNRGSKFMTYRNLFLTMVLGGLWHGANWTFIVWGFIHGSALALNHFFVNFFETATFRTFNAYKLFSWFLTISVVMTAWVFFRASSIQQGWDVLRLIGTYKAGWTTSSIGFKFFEIVILFLATHVLIHKYTFRKKVSEAPWYISAFLFSSFLLLSAVYYVEGKDFIYFQF